MATHVDGDGPKTVYEFTVIIERDEDGAFIALCPALQGCHSAGDTGEEAREMIKDAIRLHVEARLALKGTLRQILRETNVTVDELLGR